ncbi:hypothetical protein BDR04DRAFT_1161707 [Suillus decipiens]|nr:hypothetical protein BDR04DRAFT_1161707 [Suillus decipiens]
MLDITPPSGVDTSLDVYDHHHAHVQEGNHFYDFLYLIRADTLECDGFLEAIFQAMLSGRVAPGHNTTSLQRRISEIRQYLLTVQLTIRCTTDSTVYGVTTPPDEDGTAVIGLNKDLIKEWLATCRDDLYSGYMKEYSNFYLLQLAIYITVLHDSEYIHVIMYRFSTPGDTGSELIRGKAVETGYWVEGWLSQHGHASFLYEEKKAHVFNQMCAVHFVDADGSFIELTRDFKYASCWEVEATSRSPSQLLTSSSGLTSDWLEWVRTQPGGSLRSDFIRRQGRIMKSEPKGWEETFCANAGM